MLQFMPGALQSMPLATSRQTMRRERCLPGGQHPCAGCSLAAGSRWRPHPEKGRRGPASATTFATLLAVRVGGGGGWSIWWIVVRCGGGSTWACGRRTPSKAGAGRGDLSRTHGESEHHVADSGGSRSAGAVEARPVGACPPSGVNSMSTWIAHGASRRAG